MTHLETAKKNLKMGYNLHQAGYIEEAISYYAKSIEIYPTAEAYNYMGWAYGVLGQPEVAIEYCQMSIDIDPDYGSPYNDIGAYLIQLRKYAEAEHYLFEALEKKNYKTRHFAYYNLGYLHERTGEWFEAVQYYKKGYELAPEYAPCTNAYFYLQGILN